MARSSKCISNTWAGFYMHRVFLFDANIGLMQQWYFAFEPKHDFDIGFILEDDLEVTTSQYA